MICRVQRLLSQGQCKSCMQSCMMLTMQLSCKDSGGSLDLGDRAVETSSLCLGRVGSGMSFPHWNLVFNLNEM